MSDILRLPSLKVISVKCKSKYYINAETVKKPSLCPCCGAISPRLRIQAHKRQIFHDLRIHGKMVGILVDRKRYLCVECGKTFMEPLPDLDEKRSVTKRLLEYIQERAASETFKSLADESGISEATVRRIFHDYFTERLKGYRPETPRVLGIDEAHLLHDYRCVLTNIEESCILDMLKNRNKPTVIDYLSRMPHRERIEAVCMDMWDPYREAVGYLLPKARIIADKYHVVRGANKALDDLRKAIGQGMKAGERRKLMHSRFLLLKRASNLDQTEQFKLECWLCQQPLLKKAHGLKEEFFNIFDSRSTKLQAMTRYVDWEKAVKADPALYKVFKDLITSMTNWRTEIFNYFDCFLSNAATESMNSIIKELNEDGKGYSFAVLRAKVLFYSQAEKTVIEYPTYNRDDFTVGMMVMEGMDYHKRVYGIYIPTFLQYLERESNSLDPTRCDG
jgi:transposase